MNPNVWLGTTTTKSLSILNLRLYYFPTIKTNVSRMFHESEKGDLFTNIM